MSNEEREDLVRELRRELGLGGGGGGGEVGRGKSLQVIFDAPFQFHFSGNRDEDSFNLKSQDLLEKTKPRLPPAPPHSRSLGEIREGRREGGLVRGERRREEREVEGGGRRMSEEEMTILLKEVPLPSLKSEISNPHEMFLPCRPL